MLTVFVVLALLLVSVVGVQLLLKSMGEDGVEAAAPGSCKSGKCGVQPVQAGGASPEQVPVQFVKFDEVKRLDRNLEHEA